MLPYTAFYHLLFKYLDNPIIATSANLSGEPIIIKRKDIVKKLPFVDYVVDYNRKIINAIDDSVVQIVNDDMVTMRLSRGFAPKEIILPFKLKNKILSVGANSKNSICLAFDNKIILSPHIGDIDSLNSFEFFTRTIKTFRRFYDFKPDIILCDKHNNYETTKWAKRYSKKKNIKIFEIQHHKAHIYSVKAEFNLKGNNYTGFSFDGTGLGDDGTLWGGEVFVKDKRRYYFKHIKLLGGAMAIKEPRRVALGMLFEKYSLDEILKLNLPTIKSFTTQEIKLFYQNWDKNLNTTKSSSIGRYFDGVASISGLCQYQSYEGEAGLLTQTNIKDKKINIKDSFRYNIVNGVIDIDFDFFDDDLVVKFYNTLANIVLKISQKQNLDVILSGGVFQNKTLLELICKTLKTNNIKYHHNKTTPINDGGISLGQMWFFLSNLY
jgi:hydrogenase maturation protein HypF